MKRLGQTWALLGEVLGWTDLLPRQRVVVVVRIALLLVTISGLLVLAWIVPTWQTSTVLLATQIEFVKTMAQIILGALVLGTLWVAWQRAKAAEQTVIVAQEGQITDRFTKAVEQLGNSKNMTIRLGGIYALERIAKDSKKDHWPAMEVLTSYVRYEKWWTRLGYANPDRMYYELSIEDGQFSIPADIQAILSVLRRRNFKWEEPDQRLDLSGAFLLGTNMRGANLRGVNFTGADLRSANLICANLRGAILSIANLQGANLQGANLTNADFQSGVILTDADPWSANFINDKLRMANFRMVNLQGANLQGANLSNANFRGAELNRTIGLTQEQVDSAITDGTTKLPGYLTESQNQ